MLFAVKYTPLSISCISRIINGLCMDKLYKKGWYNNKNPILPLLLWA